MINKKCINDNIKFINDNINIYLKNFFNIFLGGKAIFLKILYLNLNFKNYLNKKIFNN